MPEKPHSTHDRNIIESLPYALMCVDGRSSVISMNLAAEDLTEVSRTIASGKPLKELFPADKWLIELFTSGSKEGKFVSSYKTALQRRLSPPLAVSVSTASLTDESGNPGGVIFIIKDASIKALDDEASLKNNIERMGAFAAALAHEIKNPLGGIRGTAELLRRKTEDKKLIEYATVIIEASDRLNDIVSRMLGLEKARLPKKSNINIHKTIDTGMKLFENEEGKARFTRVYDPSLPPVVGDETALSQVFTNLIKNAVESLTGTKDAEITLSTRMVTEFHLIESGSKERKFVEVEIKDNGSGIKTEDMERIFTPFFTTKRGGSGLGLGISYKIIKEHGGFLRIESVPKAGTRVKVYLPARVK